MAQSAAQFEEKNPWPLFESKLRDAGIKFVNTVGPVRNLLSRISPRCLIPAETITLRSPIELSEAIVASGIIPISAPQPRLQTPRAEKTAADIEKEVFAASGSLRKSARDTVGGGGSSFRRANPIRSFDDTERLLRQRSRQTQRDAFPFTRDPNAPSHAGSSSTIRDEREV